MKKRRNNNFRDEKFSPTSNEGFADAMRELRRSSAASRHVSTRHKGSRADRRLAAIRDAS